MRLGLIYQENYCFKNITFFKRKNIPQKELAEKMNCSLEFIETILKGSENLTLETICKLEKVLGISLIKINLND